MSAVPDRYEGWRRLSARMIWVDLAQSVLSTLPAVIAILVVGVEPSAGTLWPLIGLAAFGIIGAVADALRWWVTRYRVTASHVELRSGILVRQHRSVQRERIRSVDIEARLRHRVSGLRVVAIGAGQQAAAGESAFRLDAVTAADARDLQSGLLRTAASPIADAGGPDVAGPDTAPADGSAAGGEGGERAPAPQVLARFRARWVVHNMFSIWAYVLALGLGWGGLWLLSSFGVDVVGWVTGLLDWEAVGWVGVVLIAVAAVTLVGVVGLAVTYFLEFWNFELARVPAGGATMLRTRKGLFTTREVNRDEVRIRGVQLSQPLFWRWMGVTDTSVITTGLDVWSMAEPATILPRTPLTVARRVAVEVLGAEAAPLRATLTSHPRAALLRRLGWATGLSAATALILGWLALTGVVLLVAVWAAAVLWPLSLGAAWLAYRALGHTIAGSYLVTRSGLFHRATTVLQRSAVSTVAVRESLLQRCLGLRTVGTATAAGYGWYETPDLETDRALEFALQAAPGLLDPFVTRQSGTPLP